jgi:glycosyltransferase involved in cell wall biosynthesis
VTAAAAPRKLRLLLLNIRTDVDDTALGFTTAWINSLAPRFERVDVITMHRGTLAVCPNVHVHSLGREAGASRVARVLRFYRLAIAIVVRVRPDVCFAHMTPLLASLFAPIARLGRIKLLLWYAHGNVTRELRIAERLADRCATSTPNGFRLPSSKLAVLGQGVDTNRFTFRPGGAQAGAGTVLSIGRLTAAKHVDEAIRALALLPARQWRLRVVGGPITGADESYEAGLHALARELHVDDRVEFAGPVPFSRIAGEYRPGAVFLNLSTTGSLDKAILEAMASGCIPVSRNDSFQVLARDHDLEQLVPGEGPEGVAHTLLAIGRLDAGERSDLQLKLRGIVREEHSLERLAGMIYAELEQLAGGAAR